MEFVVCSANLKNLKKLSVNLPRCLTQVFYILSERSEQKNRQNAAVLHCSAVIHFVLTRKIVKIFG